MNAVVVVLVVLVIGLGYSRLARIRRTVKNPQLGILDVSNGRATALVAADKGSFAEVFPVPKESSDDPPRCDVLLVYGDLDEGGRIKGCARGLREIIREADAKVVLASENDVQSCTQATARKPYGQANLVITFAHRGDAFPRLAKGTDIKTKALRNNRRVADRSAGQRLCGNTRDDAPRSFEQNGLRAGGAVA